MTADGFFKCICVLLILMLVGAVFYLFDYAIYRSENTQGVILEHRHYYEYVAPITINDGKTTTMIPQPPDEVYSVMVRVDKINKVYEVRLPSTDFYQYKDNDTIPLVHKTTLIMGIERYVY